MALIRLSLHMSPDVSQPACCRIPVHPHLPVTQARAFFWQNLKSKQSTSSDLSALSLHVLKQETELLRSFRVEKCKRLQ